MYTDARWTRIPNVITYPTMLIGLVLGAVEGLPGGVFTNGLVDHIAALVLAFAFAFPLYQFGGLKAGDAKLLMAIGAMRGTTFLLVSLVYGAILGGVFALLFIAVRLIRARGAEGVTVRSLMKTWMPYGVSLALGGLVALAAETLVVNQVSGS